MINKVLSLTISVIMFIANSYAQTSTSSHYSRFGLGELEQGVLPYFNALGGSSTAFSNPNIINPKNPATYMSFRSKAFLFSTGGWHQTTKMQNNTAEQISNNNGFSHLLLGFPISKSIGVSFGMIPFSSIGYDINTTITSVDNDYTGIANYSGDGGISKVYFGGAYEISESLSFGINASYLFGGLNRRKRLLYDDESFLNSRSNSKINLRGYYYELGLLYNRILNEDSKFSIGLIANNNSSIKAKKSELVESFRLLGTSEIPKDTFSLATQLGSVVLPRYVSVGVAYYQQNKWVLVLDYSTQDWSDYSMFNESDNLANSMKLSGGVQYTPDYSSISKYYKRIDYRVGASYSNTPLQFENNQLNELSVSFGFGVPVRKSRTKYDISCTFGQRGTVENNLIKEQFIRLGLSVSYDGVWFEKQKYD